MAFAGIGVDMVEIARMARVMERRPSFLDRVFTAEERAYCDGSARPAHHYAARFAAREAVLKALGVGFSEGVGLADVSVARGESGRPSCVLNGRAAQIARERGVQEVELSLSFTRELAVANALAVTQDVRPRQDERPTPREELARSFKRARSVIDELDRLQDGITDTLEGTPDSVRRAGEGPLASADDDPAGQAAAEGALARGATTPADDHERPGSVTACSQS
ncbi:holo-ACP synthase [Olsenella sp. HMSC062G07]|uniref:holo-ACP synthase n=1 Tax=Olsenella sp. HMSC062G07 TaxID=1739330 RepID=UPI0008A19456